MKSRAFVFFAAITLCAAPAIPIEMVDASAAPVAGPAVREVSGHIPRRVLWRRNTRLHLPISLRK